MNNSICKYSPLDWSQYLGECKYESVDIEGLPSNFQGIYLNYKILQKNIKVFAIIGKPKNVKNAPAVVLVHGAGGHSYYEWVKSWVERGYIAIAPDINGTCYKDSLNNLVKNAYCGATDIGSKYSFFKNPKQSWTYGSVATIVSCVSFLHGLSEVNKDKIAIVGISWGGAMSLIASGIDKRIKASAIIYSAGNISQDLLGLEMGMGEDKNKKLFYDTYFEPNNYIENINCPILFQAGLKDGAFSPVSRKITCDKIGKNAKKSFVLDLYHDNESNFDNKVVFEFIDNIFFNTKPLLEIMDIKVNGNNIDVEYEGEVEKIQLYYVDKLSNNAHQWEWKTFNYNDESKHSFPIPKNAKAFVLTLFNKKGIYVSTDLLYL